MGQLDKYKNFVAGNDERPSVLEPKPATEPTLAGPGEPGKPGYVVPSQVVATGKTGETLNTDPVDVNGGGGRFSRLSVRAGDTVRTLQGRLRTPRPKVGPVFDSSSTFSSKAGITGPTEAEMEQTRLKHLKDIGSSSVETKSFRGTSTVVPKQPKAPEPTGHIVGNPLGKEKFDANGNPTSTTMRMTESGRVYDEDELQVGQGEDLAKGIEDHLKIYGTTHFRGADLEARNAGTQPGLAESRRERKLAGKRGTKATGFSGMFDKSGNPISAQHTGDTGPKFEGERPLVGATPVTKPVGSTVVEENISDAAHDLRASMTEGKEPDILSTTMREHQLEGPEQATGEYSPVYGSRETVKPAPAPKRPRPENLIPNRALDTFTNQGVSADEQAKVDRQRKGRMASGTQSSVYDPNATASRPTRGQTPERAIVSDAKLIARNAELSAGVTTHPQGAVTIAKAMGRRAGLSADAMASPLFHRSTHMRDAVIMHHAGATEENLNAWAGGRPLEAEDKKKAAYQSIDRKIRFEATKNPGTGYTYGFSHPEGGGRVNPTDYFKSSSGSLVSMSDINHPEHPLRGGRTMEGSHVPFRGFIPREDGSYEHSFDKHHGWHPYDRGGKRVFEYHEIPENAIHEADTTISAIQTGTTTSQIARSLAGGKDTDVTVAGTSLTAAPTTRTPKVERKPEEMFTPPTPSADSRAGHAEITSGITDQLTQSAASVTAPDARTGRVAVRNIGQAPEEAVIRNLTDKEAAQRSAVPAADDSKIIVGTSPAAKPSSEPLSFTPPARKPKAD